MKKLALFFCAALAASMLFGGCGKDDAAPAPESSGTENTSSASSAASMPTTEAEIVKHNDQISADSITLLQAEAPKAGAPIATIKTSMGDIKMVLYPEEAPKAVENFIALAKDGFYNGLGFYEVMPGVRVSAGDPQNDGTGGKSSSGDKFADEYSLNLWHFNGAVAMVNGGLSNNNDSKFYIVQGDKLSDDLLGQIVDGGFPTKVCNQYLEVGGIPAFDFRDTVFGQVTEGMEVVEKIATASRDSNNKPQEDITITSIEIAE